MKLKGMTTHKAVHAELMKRPGYKEAYDAVESEFTAHDSFLGAQIKKNLA